MQSFASTPGTLALLMVLITAIAGLIGWLAGRRRAHALEVELAAARAELASSDEVARERAQALDLALERLRSGFDSVAEDALRSNSELFLQLAREMLGQQQQVALRNLTDREKSVEGMLAPVREALQKTHEQINRIEKERAESFGALRSSIEKRRAEADRQETGGWGERPASCLLSPVSSSYIQGSSAVGP